MAERRSHRRARLTAAWVLTAALLAGYWAIDDKDDDGPVGPPALPKCDESGELEILEVSPGDQFHWECDVDNKSQVTLRFSNKVYEGEMCNVFGFYFTENRAASPWTCVFL